MVGYAGLASCGRIWLCPVCNAKIMARRAIDLGLALAWAHANGLRVIWGSLTMRHTAADALSDLLAVQTQAWSVITNSRAWRRASTTKQVRHEHAPSCDWDCTRVRDYIDTGMGGRVGYVRAAEITIGHHGWHPHFHPLIFWRGSAAAAEVFAAEVVATWVDAVHDAGGDALGNDAQHLRVLEPDEYSEPLSGYMTKATYQGSSLAYEAAWSQGKMGEGRSGRKRAIGTASHWSLLAALVDVERTGEVTTAVTRWQELEAATHGHRMLQWSRGLRGFVGLTEKEASDEEIAAEEVGTRDDTVCFITGDGWRAIRDRADLAAGLLSVLEAEGWAGLRDFLDAHGVEWFVLTPSMA